MSFNLQDYLAEGVEVILKDAIRATIKNPKQSRFILKFSKHARKATKIRESYDEKGPNIPVFLIASVTSRCNLHCKGCYSRANDNEPSNQLSADEWEDIFSQARDLGISFIVLAGGEPLLRSSPKNTIKMQLDYFLANVTTIFTPSRSISPVNSGDVGASSVARRSCVS